MLLVLLARVSAMFDARGWSWSSICHLSEAKVLKASSSWTGRPEDDCGLPKKACPPHDVLWLWSVGYGVQLLLPSHVLPGRGLEGLIASK
jgi:hypothetical protein